MERLTFEGNFCDIAQCYHLPCPHGGSCTQKQVWERLKAYEDKADEIALKLMRLADLESICSYTRLRELAEADKEGRLIIVDNTPRQISPCDTCESGWGTATITGYNSCFNHCEKLAEYREQKEYFPDGFPRPKATVEDLERLRDELYEDDLIAMEGLKRLNALIYECAYGNEGGENDNG